jgi:hypothetical protein
MFLLSVSTASLPNFKSKGFKSNGACPAGSKGFIHYEPKESRLLSLKMNLNPGFSTPNNICSTLFFFSTETKWSVAFTSVEFTGTSSLHSDAIGDTYASIESSVMFGNVKKRFVVTLDSVHFPDNDMGQFTRKIEIDKNLIRWSPCDDKFAIRLDLSIMLQSFI